MRPSPPNWTDKTLTWTERRLVVRSLCQAHAGEVRLRQRLVRAQAEVLALNQRGRGKRRCTSAAQLRQAAETLVARHHVEGLLDLAYTIQISQRQVRGYKGRPARGVTQTEHLVSVAVNEGALHETLRMLGWHVYATNATPERLSLTQAVLAYRAEYLVEQDFSRFKGHPLSLTPTYLQYPHRVKGLTRLLSIGLRALSLLEFVVRRALAREQSALQGLYAGNPTRATARPTAERLLAAFQNITLTVIHESDRVRKHLTPLSTLQQRILQLLGLSPVIYTDFALDSS